METSLQMWLHLSFLYEVSRQAVENWVHLFVFPCFYPVVPKPYLPSLTTGLLSIRPCEPCSLSEHCPSAGPKQCWPKLRQRNKNSLNSSAGSAAGPGQPTSSLLQEKECNFFHLSPCNLKWFLICPSLSWWRHCTTWTEMSKFYLSLSQSKAVSLH